MTYDEAYELSHVEFEISDIKYEDDALEGEPNIPDDASPADIASLPSNITFEYPAPAISVDSAGRFITHEIIGGATVRQKIGEDPVEVSISGVCKEGTARQLDELRNAKYGRIYSKRLEGGSLDVHFASISTSPFDDAGAVDMKDSRGEFLYTYDISAVEVSFDV